jgi:outer membrane lipoprotein LolB
MMLLTRRLAILALAATVLTGCATSTANLSTATVGAYRETIALAGRLSVNYQKDGRPESISGSFNWEQRAGTIDVTLMSPLGQTVAECHARLSYAHAGRPGAAYGGRHR